MTAQIFVFQSYRPLPVNGFTPLPKMTIVNNKRMRQQKIEEGYIYEVLTSHCRMDKKLRPEHFSTDTDIDFVWIPLNDGCHWMFLNEKDIDNFQIWAQKRLSR